MSGHVKPRTCCETHSDNCRFGRMHDWAGPFLLDQGRPINGQIWSHDEDLHCATCGGVCTAGSEDDARRCDHDTTWSRVGHETICDACENTVIEHTPVGDMWVRKP